MTERDLAEIRSLPNGGIIDQEFAPVAPAPPETVAMDEAFITLIADFRRQAQAIEAQAQGALVLFLRQNGLGGSWRIADNGRELVRVPAP